MFKDLSTPTPPWLHLCYPSPHKIREILLFSQQICEQSLENLNLWPFRAQQSKAQLWGSTCTVGRKILLHLLNQSSQTLCVYPYSLSLRNEGSTVLLSTKSCCAALHGEQTQIWHSSSLLANGQGAQGVWSGSPASSGLGETPSIAKSLFPQH